MGRTYATRSSAGPMFYGGVGGALAALVAAAVLAVAAAISGQPASTALNAVGAWVVRWLQLSAPDALEGFYYDATLGGAAIVVLIGALAGAVLGGLLARFPNDQPLAWGIMSGAVVWAVVTWVVAPTLDPVLARAVDGKVLFASCLTYGVLVGVWMRVGRRARPDTRREARTEWVPRGGDGP